VVAVTVRVLVVDDSALARSLITTVLARDPEVEVVGQAGSGEQALGAAQDLRPDLVTLDVEMPGMDGLETLRRLRDVDRSLPVIMFSSLTVTGAAATLDALAMGADDYVAKPSGATSRDEALEGMSQDLLPRVKALAARRTWRRGEPGRGAPDAPFPDVAPPAGLSHPAPPAAQQPLVDGAARSPRRRTAGGGVSVVAVGCSTGGPDALAQLLPALPGDLPVPVLVVVHMPAVFTRLLSQRLDRASALSVREAEDGEPLRAGIAYVAPGDRHLTVERAGAGVVARLDDGPKQHFARPAVDPLLRSLPAAYGSRALALVLTGMGHDGLVGAAEVQAAGGLVVVQDEASSAVWGMAGAVARAGLAAEMLDPAGLARYVARAVRT
jgi:two-component system, chemotaxis family, protein-glutamate methylesterase/glutaminase